jgi:hypothetical protein
VKFRNVAFASTAAVIAALAIGTGAAQASGLLSSHDIEDNGVRSIDLRDGGVHNRDLSRGVQAKIAQHAKDGVTDLNAGAGYNHTWAGDNGASLNTIVAKCDAGQVALSGGFSTWGGSDTNESGLAYDLGGDNKNIQVTVSAPYTGQAYDETKYHGGILPDRWVVKGYNNGNADQIVRAWVVCANAS